MPKGRYKAIICQSKRHKNRIISEMTESSRPKNEQPRINTINYEPFELPHILNSYDCDRNIDNALDISSHTLEHSLAINEASFNSSEEDISSRDPLAPTFQGIDVQSTPDPTTFCDELASWAIKGNISQTNLNDLLAILRKHACFAELPKDSRTILHTPRSYTNSIRVVKPGNYYHFGIETGIHSKLKKLHGNINEIPNVLCIQINIDGTPISKSSGSQFWPILGSLVEIDPSPFMIGAYHGLTKPECSNNYLEEFVLEANNLIENGCTFGDKRYKLKITSFICDAPARSFVKKVKGHNGYFGCDRCTQKGACIENRTVFPDLNAVTRTDESFLRQDQEEHHTGTSILTNINGIKMISEFPHDYMHLVCLGAMRKLIMLWMRGKIPMRLPSRAICEISQHSVIISKSILSEFARKPRSLREIDRWKATEFRLILLYTWPVVLKCIKRKYYTHYLALCCAIRILVKPDCNDLDITDARRLIEYFLHYYERLYGPEQLSYNVHSLIHIADDVQRLGSVDSFSAFKFENYLYSIKKLIRSSALPLQQLIRRVHEERNLNYSGSESFPPTPNNFPQMKQVHHNGPLERDTTNPQYKKIKFQNFIVCSINQDNCVQLKDGTVIIVENIATSLNGQIVIIGKQFLGKTRFFQKPFDSSKVGIFEVFDLQDSRNVWDINEIQCKAIKLPLDKDDHFYVALILHC